MEATWQYTGQEPVKIKKFLQSLGMGHRLFNEIKKGQGQFLVDHRVVRPTTQILPNQPLTIQVAPETADPTVAVSHEPLKVAYEDDNWLVVDKPAGGVFNSRANHQQRDDFKPGQGLSGGAGERGFAAPPDYPFGPVHQRPAPGRQTPRGVEYDQSAGPAAPDAQGIHGSCQWKIC